MIKCGALVTAKRVMRYEPLVRVSLEIVNIIQSLGNASQAQGPKIAKMPKTSEHHASFDPIKKFVLYGFNREKGFTVPS